MLTEQIEINNGNLKAISSFVDSINSTPLSKLDNLFNSIVNDSEINIDQWSTEDYNHFVKEIDLVNNCQNSNESTAITETTSTSSTEEEEEELKDTFVTKKYIPNIFISFISTLQECQNKDDGIDSQIYDIIVSYLYSTLNGDVDAIANYIIPSTKKDLLNEQAIPIVTLLISSLKSLLNENGQDMKGLVQCVLDRVNQIDIEETEKADNTEYLNFMLSLFSELFNDLDLKKVIRLLWEVTHGNTEQISEYISYLLYDQSNQKEEDEGAESKHFGLATRIVIEEYIEPLQQKQRRQMIRNRNNNKGNEVSSTASNTQNEEEAANADLNEIYTFIKQVLHHTCLDDDQQGYPKELALFFSSFEDFWEPDRILKFIIESEETDEDSKCASRLEDRYREYYGPFLMDLADLMNWTNKQCETALLILTEGWKRKSRISIAKMMGLSVNDIKHLYNDCKDLTYNDPDYLSDNEEHEDDRESEGHEENPQDPNIDNNDKPKKPVVLSIRGSDFKRSYSKPVTDKDNVSNGNQTICRYYGTPRGCSAGKHCPFRHINSRSSYITRRLNHSMYANSKSSYNGRYGSRYHHSSGPLSNSVKRRTSFQNASNYRSSRNNGMDLSGKGRINSRISGSISTNDPSLKYSKKSDYESRDKKDIGYGRKDSIMHHKLRKQASFINSSSYRNQAPKEYKPIEAIDPAIPQHNHSNIICYYYNDPRGCSNGKNCKFLHINANDRSRGYDNARNSYGYDNSNGRKSYGNPPPSSSSYGGHSYSSYGGSDNGGRHGGMHKKLSRSMMRTTDPKLRQDYNSSYGSYKRNSNARSNTHDDSPVGKDETHPASITIVNSSQKAADTTSTSTTTSSAIANPTSTTGTAPSSNPEAPTSTSVVASDESSVKKETSYKSMGPSSSKVYPQTACVFFAKDGNCKYGDKCKFLHLQ